MSLVRHLRWNNNKLTYRQVTCWLNHLKGHSQTLGGLTMGSGWSESITNHALVCSPHLRGRVAPWKKISWQERDALLFVQSLRMHLRQWLRMTSRLLKIRWGCFRRDGKAKHGLRSSQSTHQEEWSRWGRPRGLKRRIWLHRDPIVEERLEDKDDAEDEEQGQQDGQVFPDVPEALPDARDSELTSALRTRGPNAVDGVPGLLQQPSPGETQCSVPGCELPGGHEGPHQGHDRRSFSWTPFGGRVNVDESSSSEDSEEMIPDEDRGSSSPRTSAMKRPYGGDEEDVFYALELEVTKEDGIYLSNHPRKAAIWLSRKVQEKGKETQWSRLTLDQKKEFDLAQAKEITNVVQSKALRSLTEQEWLHLDKRKIMQMRWVLTRKQDGSPKARLVVLAWFPSTQFVCCAVVGAHDGSVEPQHAFDVVLQRRLQTTCRRRHKRLPTGRWVVRTRRPFDMGTEWVSRHVWSRSEPSCDALEDHKSLLRLGSRSKEVVRSCGQDDDFSGMATVGIWPMHLHFDEGVDIDWHCRNSRRWLLDWWKRRRRSVSGSFDKTARCLSMGKMVREWVWVRWLPHSPDFRPYHQGRPRRLHQSVDRRDSNRSKESSFTKGRSNTQGDFAVARCSWHHSLEELSDLSAISSRRWTSTFRGSFCNGFNFNQNQQVDPRDETRSKAVFGFPYMAWGVEEFSCCWLGRCITKEQTWPILYDGDCDWYCSQVHFARRRTCGSIGGVA